ncbi:MAG TPA: family 16 glycoside hydrolase [Actinopolymorphaceae bacterium]
MLGHVRSLILAGAVLLTGALCVTPTAPAAADAPGELLYRPTSSTESNAYARMIRLAHAGEQNGRLLATWEHWHDDGTPAEFEIRSSDDNGETWQTLATVGDPQTGPGHPVSRMWQPFLFEFPHEIGGYAAGTLLLVGNTVPSDGSFTEFVAWRSSDHGRTWAYEGVIQRGGTFGQGIWEPFLTLDKRGRLLMYFADERDAPTHSQMIVHVVSTDGGRTWGPVVRDVASAVPGDRPGMPTVVRMGERGEYALSYEICGRPHCEVRLKYSRDGARWSDPTDLGVRAQTTDGRYLGHSPYVTWLPTPDGGQLVLAAQRVFSDIGDQPTEEDYRAVFVNTEKGRGPWSWAPAPWRVSNASSSCNANYSPHLMPDGPDGVLRYTAPTSIGGSGPCGEATGTARVATLPYEDTFADGEPRGQAGWNTYGGCWAIQDGAFAETCGGNDAGVGPKALTGSTGWTDYTVAADVRITSDAGDAGLLARVTDPATGADAHHGYLAFFDVGAGRLVLARQEYAYISLASAPVNGGTQPNTWYRLSLTVDGATLTATMRPTSGGPTTTVTFTDPYASFPHGLAGVRDHAGTAAFRNVRITPAG